MKRATRAQAPNHRPRHAPADGRRGAPRRRRRRGRRGRGRTPLLFTGRHRHPLALTDRRLIVFERRHRRHQRRRARPRRADRPARARVGTLAAHAVPGDRRRRRRAAGRVRVPAPRPRHGHCARPDARTPPGRPEMAVVLAIDAGTTGVRTVAVDEHGRAGRVRVPRVHPALPAPGWVEHDPVEIWQRGGRHAGRGRRRARRPAGRRRSGSRTSARRRWCGTGATGAPLHRALVWQDRRTAAPLRRAARPPGHEPLVRVAHRTRARPVLLGDEARVAPHRRRRRALRRPRVRHRRLVDPVEPHRRRRPAACTPPSRRTRVARCSSTSTRLAWSPRAARRCSTSRASCLPDVLPTQRALRHDRARRGGGSARAGQRHRRRPAGGAVRSGVLHAGHEQEHLRHRLVRAREPRPIASRRRSTACSPPSRGRSAPRSRTRSRDRSS